MSIKTKLITLFLAFTVIPVLILGALSLNRARESVTASTLSRLQGLADAKARWLTNFFSERVGDLQVALNSANVKKNLPILDRLIDNRSDPAFIEAQAELRSPLLSIERAFGYNDIFLVNPAGRVIYAANPKHARIKLGAPYPDPDGQTLASARKGPYLSRMYLDQTKDGSYEIAAAGPVSDQDGKFIGFLLFEINMNPVFQALGETQGLGKTGEVVLGRREGDSILFLNPLRNNPKAALKLSIPFRPGPEIFPIQAALLRASGEGEAKDYTGRDVLAAWRYLPSMGWGLVVKIDAAEAFAPVAELRDRIYAIGIAAILLGAVLAFLLGRSFTRPLLELEQGAEIIGAGNLDHKINNPNPDEIGQLARAFDQMTERLKTITASRDELNAEIVERARAEKEALRANQALLTLSRCNEAMVRAGEETELLEQVCQILVETGGYRLAWIGYCQEDPEKTVRPVAQAGFEDGYLEDASITFADTERGRGPTGTAIRAGKPVACQNLLTDPSFQPWRNGAIQRGYSSSLAIPLFEDGKVLGALMVYSSDPEAFNPREVQLLSELANDLSYGVSFLRTRAELQQSHDKLEVRVEERTRELAQAAEEWSRTFDSISDLIMIIDNDHRVVRINRAAREALERDQPQILGKHCYELIHRSGQSHRLCPHARTLRDGREHSEEIFEPSLGHHFQVTTTPLLTMEGNTLGSVHVMHNITVKKMAEEELKKHREHLEELVEARTAEVRQVIQDLVAEAEERKRAEDRVKAERQRFNDVLETLPAYICLLTPDYHMPFANRVFRELFGESGGRRCFEFLFNRAEPCETCETFAALKTHAPHHWEWLGPNGHNYDVHDFPFIDTDGSAMILEMGIDITERKRAEERLRQSESSLAEAQRIAHLGNWDWNIETNALYWSDEIYRIFGLGPQEFGATYDAFLDRVHPEDRASVTASVNEALQGAKPYSIEHRIVRPGGEERVVHETGEITRDRAGKPVRMIGTVQDITLRRRAELAKEKVEQELEAQRALAIRSDRLRSLGEMAAGIAHELNQPLLGVRGLAEHVIIGFDRGWEFTDEKIRDKVKLIVDQADRMSHIIEHVRSFARGADGLDASPVEVNAVVRAGLGLLGSQLKSRGLRLELELNEDLPPVLANPFSLEEVVINIVNNARDALEANMAKGAAPSAAGIKVRTFTDTDAGEQWVNIEIRDSGPGIPEEVMDRVFTPFFTTKSPDKGTGLGLAISRSIIEKFQGAILVANAPAGGAVVTIKLPALQEQNQAPPLPSPSKE